MPGSALRGLRLLAAALCVGPGLLALGPPPVFAHGSAVTTDPADNARVAGLERAQLQFDQPVRLTAVSLYDADGEELALPESRSLTPEPVKQVRMPDGLAPGRYRIEWRALSEDGHVIKGGVSFHLIP